MVQKLNPYAEQMQSDPLVSIIIPFLNEEKFLQETIKSVLGQEYENWELILIDDGSSDQSTAIAKSYVAMDGSKFIYADHPNHINRGLSASRNLGISKAQGKYVTFLDADDFLTPQKLKRQVACLESNPEVTVVCEATKFWYSWANPAVEDEIVSIGVPAGEIYYPPKLSALTYPLGKGSGFCVCAIMMRSTSLEKIGGFNETFVGPYQLYEDQVMYSKIYLNETVYVSAECNNWYRQRPNSMVHGLRAQGHNKVARHYFLAWLEQYITDKEINDKDISRLLNQALMPFRHPVLYKLKQRGGKLKAKLKTYFDTKATEKKRLNRIP
jgi:glycosyltransferase involved in cell wall biosynthesis